MKSGKVSSKQSETLKVHVGSPGLSGGISRQEDVGSDSPRLRMTLRAPRLIKYEISFSEFVKRFWVTKIITTVVRLFVPD